MNGTDNVKSLFDIFETEGVYETLFSCLPSNISVFLAGLFAIIIIIALYRIFIGG